jgi:hypothetical protein
MGEIIVALADCCRIIDNVIIGNIVIIGVVLDVFHFISAVLSTYRFVQQYIYQFYRDIFHYSIAFLSCGARQTSSRSI